MSNVVFPRALRNIMSGCQHVTIKAVHRDKLTSLFNMEMTKEQINRCPIKTFNKEIRVISSIHDEHKKENKLAIKQMQTSKILGFDTETAVVFNTNINLPISLIQLSNEDTVILWRLRSEWKFLQPSFPKTLKDILQSRDIIKVGTGNDGDIADLYNQYQIKCACIFDTQKIAKDLGFVKLGLASLTAQLFGWRVSKDRRLSNWEARNLDRSQVVYGATDAWSSLLVYKKLTSIMDELGLVPNELPSVFDLMLHRESRIDHSIFCAIDKKICEATRVKKIKFQRRRKRKLRLTVDEFDLSAYVNSHTQELCASSTKKKKSTKTFSCNVNTDQKHVRYVNPVGSHKNETMAKQNKLNYDLPFV